jgi:hypothetical protein
MIKELKFDCEERDCDGRQAGCSGPEQDPDFLSPLKAFSR